MRKWLALFIISSILHSTCFSLTLVNPNGHQNCAKSSTAAKIVQETFQVLKIMGGSILSAVTYGILNDQVTVRVCPEYFSKGFHKEMMDRWKYVKILNPLRKILKKTKSPTVVGAIWGTVATWWMGVLLGIPVTLAARLGSWPKLTMNELVKPIAIALGTTGVGALTSGIKGYLESKNENIKEIWKFEARGVPESDLRKFIACAYAHNAAYSIGTLAGLGLILWIIAKRYSKKKNLNTPLQPKHHACLLHYNESRL